jgi:pyridoxamine 5'-phosphate oxidase
MTNPPPPPVRSAEEDPFALFVFWFEEAQRTEALAEAMTLATASVTGRPAARMVLLKGVDPHGAAERGFVFYTNRESRKGRELAANPAAALLFYWKSQNRQVRIEGEVREVSAAEADAYFATRPRLSRLGAWASAQSAPLPDRATLEARLREAEARFPGETIPRPPYWTGYRLVPEAFEFWEERPYRLHERRLFRREGEGWQQTLLYP